MANKLTSEFVVYFGRRVFLLPPSARVLVTVFVRLLSSVFDFGIFLQAIGVDWRQKLDSQRGAVLATELRNNSCKLAKWTVSSILAGSEYLKLG